MKTLLHLAWFGTICFRTEEPDFSKLEDPNYNWTRSVYAGAKELIPHDIPEALGKRVIQTTHVDANLLHDLIRGNSVMGILHSSKKRIIESGNNGVNHMTRDVYFSRDNELLYTSQCN